MAADNLSLTLKNGVVNPSIAVWATRIRRVNVRLRFFSDDQQPPLVWFGMVELFPNDEKLKQEIDLVHQSSIKAFAR